MQTIVEEYLAEVPDPARSTLYHIRSIIRSAVPAQTWGVIGYSIATFL